MAIDPRISLGVQAPNVGQAINIFENALMNSQTRDLRAAQEARAAELQPFAVQQAQQGIDINQQAIDDAARQREIEQENRVIQSLAAFSPALRPLLDEAQASGDTSKAQTALTERLIDLQRRGIDTTETVEAITALRNNDVDSVRRGLDVIDNEARQRGLLGAPTTSVGQREFESKVNLVKNDPELKTPAAKAAAIDLGLEAKASTSAAERIANDPVLSGLIANVEKLKASAKETGKGVSKRQQGFIDSGVEAADGVNNIKRSLELLETVKTGGVDNASLRAKQFFGVEGADEGELSARLGAAVLAQLKPIFGAAFTAAEGERLERISARFGANPETNKRLLNDALKMAERAARRGLRAAEASGDDFTAEEIQSALDGFEALMADESVATPEPERDQGVIMVDANGNRARVFKDGTFEEL